MNHETLKRHEDDRQAGRLGSADFQSAVTPIHNRPGVRSSHGLCPLERLRSHHQANSLSQCSLPEIEAEELLNPGLKARSNVQHIKTATAGRRSMLAGNHRGLSQQSVPVHSGRSQATGGKIRGNIPPGCRCLRCVDASAKNGQGKGIPQFQPVKSREGQRPVQRLKCGESQPGAGIRQEIRAEETRVGVNRHARSMIFFLAGGEDDVLRQDPITKNVAVTLVDVGPLNAVAGGALLEGSHSLQGDQAIKKSLPLLDRQECQFAFHYFQKLNCAHVCKSISGAEVTQEHASAEARGKLDGVINFSPHNEPTTS